MIALQDLTIMRGTKVLIEGASATILQGQKVGIIGRNGCGKSTLFAALQGELAPDLGSIGIPKNLKIATVAQKTPALSIAALDYVMQGDKTISALLDRRAEAYAHNLGEKIALIEDELGMAGYWTLKARAGSLLFGLGFGPDELEKPIKEFSGGWRMRLNLAQALIYQSDLLLLDEPTNHLDLDTVLFLQNFLKNYEGTLLCISHDRDFLDSFADHILHFEDHKVVLYPGNYSAYERIRAERIRAQKAARKREEAILAHMQSFVERFRYKATKAKQAQSLIKAMDRMQLTAVTQEESPFSFSFPEPERTPQVIAALKDLDAGYFGTTAMSDEDNDGPLAHPGTSEGTVGPEVVLQHVNLELLSGDRIALLGKNGQGKSTLIKTLVGALAPLKGEVVIGKGIKIGYFAQHELESLNEDQDAMWHLYRINPDAKEKELRTFLGSFAFSGDKVFDKVGTMSGGEQARLALALIAYQRPNLLLLDEPTNHLDLEMREALSVALASYSGALVLVSHDRHLVEAIADKLWLVDQGKVSEFSGDLNDYQEYLLRRAREFREAQQAAAAAAGAPAASSAQGAAGTPSQSVSSYKTKEQKQLEAQKRAALRPLKLKIEANEKKMATIESRLATIDERMADSSLYEDSNKGELEQLILERAELNQQKETLEEEWLLLNDELEAAQAQ
ncbi:MAG TPA: ATP-binding cassette domain-containing protein [Candidatus Anaerobiospirillum stercoravium]|nr:ATP-binding cassette domain-containing protein [Candidatus Anaerobiospirillum stercoravium]